MIVTIVAKGPTAEHAQKWIDASIGTLVATINDSANLVPSVGSIDYCFFSHFELLQKASETWSKTRLFISPSVSHATDKRMVSMRSQFTGDFPVDRWVSYDARFCDADDAHLEAMVRFRQTIHHHTTSAALSWLVAHNHRHVRIIGVDGGSQYATNTTGLPGEWPLDEWRQINERIASHASKIHGTKVEWYQ